MTNDSKDLSNNLNNLDLSGEKITNNDLSNNSVDISNNDNQITCLCFSGGGVKGFSFIGALEKLIEDNIIDLNKIDTYVGTSIGSMISFILSLGIPLKEIKDFLLFFNFSKLNTEVDCLNLLKDYGINNGEKIKLLLIKFLETTFGVKDITFKELYEKTNKKIIIIGTNLTKGCERTFSFEHSPDFSVITAIRISISVPIIFTPVNIDDELYVDGALVNNFPISYCPVNNTIGFYIKNSNNKKIIDIPTFMMACLSITTDTISEKDIMNYGKNIIKILNPNNEITKFDMNQEYKKFLIQMGYDAALNWANH